MLRMRPTGESLGVYLDKILILKILILSYLRARKSNSHTVLSFVGGIPDSDGPWKSLDSGDTHKRSGGVAVI